MIGLDRPQTTKQHAHALYMLDNSNYSHTLITCNIYCFSLANIQVFQRTPLTITLHAHCLSCSHLQHQRQLIRSHAVGRVRHIFTLIFNPLLLIPLFFSSFRRCQLLCGKNNISCMYFSRLLSIKSFFHSRFHGILVSLSEDNTKGLSLYTHANLIYLHA